MRTETLPQGLIRAVQPKTKSHSEKIWLVQAVVAHALHVPFNELCATTRRRPQVAFARQMAMYLCHIVFAVNLTEAGRAFGRDPSTVAHALSRIEEMREDPEFDRTVTALESQLQNAWSNA